MVCLLSAPTARSNCASDMNNRRVRYAAANHRPILTLWWCQHVYLNIDFKVEDNSGVRCIWPHSMSAVSTQSPVSSSSSGVTVEVMTEKWWWEWDSHEERPPARPEQDRSHVGADRGGHALVDEQLNLIWTLSWRRCGRNWPRPLPTAHCPLPAGRTDGAWRRRHGRPPGRPAARPYCIRPPSVLASNGPRPSVRIRDVFEQTQDVVADRLTDWLTSNDRHQCTHAAIHSLTHEPHPVSPTLLAHARSLLVI